MLALPSGIVNTSSAYFFASTAGKFGPLVKQLDDQILVVIDYSKLTPPLAVTSFLFSLDVTSNPQLVVSFPQLNATGSVLTFLISGGIEGQQYNLSIGANNARVDVLTINVPSSGDCSCDAINPVPSLYTQSPLGTAGYVNTGARYFWGRAAPANPNVLDQWYNTVTGELNEWVTDGVTMFWDDFSTGGSPFIDAPIDGTMYERLNGSWVRDPIQFDAPRDGRPYARQDGGWIIGSSGGGGGGGGGTFTLLNMTERLTVTGINAVAGLSFPPSGGLLMLIINGTTFTVQDGSFVMTGNAVSWISTIYRINLSDVVIAVYSYAPTGGTTLNLLTSQEALAVSSTNTVADVVHTPSGGLFLLVLNGVTFTLSDGSFAISGKTIHWTSTIFSINPGDTVIAVYSYAG